MIYSFISGVIGALVGAIAGAFATYLLQRRLEAERTNEQSTRQNISEARFAVELLNSTHNFAKAVKTHYAPHEESPSRHLNVPGLDVYIPNFPDRTFFLSLDFLGKRGHVNLLQHLEFYRTRSHTLTEAFRQRNAFYVEQVLPKLVGLLPFDPQTLRMTGTATPQQVIDRIGIASYSKLKSLTDTVYLDLNYVIKEFDGLFREANKVLIELFPNR